MLGEGEEEDAGGWGGRESALDLKGIMGDTVMYLK